MKPNLAPSASTNLSLLLSAGLIASCGQLNPKKKEQNPAISVEVVLSKTLEVKSHVYQTNVCVAMHLQAIHRTSKEPASLKVNMPGHIERLDMPGNVERLQYWTDRPPPAVSADARVYRDPECLHEDTNFILPKAVAPATTAVTLYLKSPTEGASLWEIYYDLGRGYTRVDFEIPQTTAKP